MITKNIPDFPNYTVNSDGEIHSLRSGMPRKLNGFKTGRSKTISVCLTDSNGKERTKQFGQIVATAFHGDLKGKVCFKDDNPLNFKPDNLYWVGGICELPKGSLPIPTREGYFASPEGKIFSNKGHGDDNIRELSQSLGRRDYWCVTVMDGKRQNRVQVHSLMAISFLGEKPTPESQVRHLDGDKNNNYATNFAWGTAQENADDRNEHGTTIRGSKSPNTTLTEDDVRKIKWSSAANVSLAHEYGVNPSTISSIKLNKSWQHVTR